MARKRCEAEWAEIYVFLKTLADGKIRLVEMPGESADALYIVDLIIRGPDEIRYYTGEEISIRKNGEEAKRVGADVFKRMADAVWTETEDADGPFEDERIDEFLRSVFIDGSPLDEAGDIVAEARDYRVYIVREFRFACEATKWPGLLFDAGEDGYFEYELSEVGDDIADGFNFMGKEGKNPSERIEYLKEKGVSPAFSRALGKWARGNMIHRVTTDAEKIAGEALRFFFYDKEGRDTAVSEAVDYLEETDAAHVAIEGYSGIYRNRITRLLVEMFRGLNFSHIFDDPHTNDRGLILAGQSGETSVYLSSSFLEFKDFLIRSVRFEAPSDGCGLSDIYRREDGRRCVKFPLRLRFDLKR